MSRKHIVCDCVAHSLFVTQSFASNLNEFLGRAERPYTVRLFSIISSDMYAIARGDDMCVANELRVFAATSL